MNNVNNNIFSLWALDDMLNLARNYFNVKNDYISYGVRLLEINKEMLIIQCWCSKFNLWFIDNFFILKYVAKISCKLKQSYIENIFNIFYVTIAKWYIPIKIFHTSDFPTLLYLKAHHENFKIKKQTKKFTFSKK